jgi:hypothetical protein
MLIYGLGWGMRGIGCLGRSEGFKAPEFGVPVRVMMSTMFTP